MRTRLKLWLATSVVLLGMGPATFAAQIRYVDANASPAGDGQSWAAAYKYLQDALADADANPDVNQIWVAKGIYTPDTGSSQPGGSGDRMATFQLINDVAIYGGFPSGGDPNWNDRDPNAHETKLSGDLNGDDGPDFANNGENSYNVVTGSGTNATAILDGFTVTGGNGDWYFPWNCGSGMINISGSPTVANCRIRHNTVVYYGGGIYNSGSHPSLTNCTIRDNLAMGNEGGGMYNANSSPTLTDCTLRDNEASGGAGVFNNYSDPTLTNCTFNGNIASGGDGGGMCNVESSPTLTDCRFEGNWSTSWSGGGMRNRDNCSPTLTSCTFIGNFANNDGAGMDSKNNCHPRLTDCDFIGNTAGGGGGGMRNITNCNPILTNCRFIGNAAGNSDGGGMVNVSGSPTLINCTFAGNSSAGWSGGGMRNADSNVWVTNCTFSGNSASSGGGGMNNEAGSATVTNCTFSGNSANDGGGMSNYNCDPDIANCIFWANNAAGEGDEIHNSNSNPAVRYCDIKGWTGGGTGNIDADPLFVNEVNGDYHLQADSPCIDAADNTAVPADTADLDDDGDTSERTPLDLDGRPRFVDDLLTEDTGVPDPPHYRGVVDMGAYEFDYVYGDLDGDGEVDWVDVGILVSQWLQRCRQGQWCNGCDINHDLKVNFGDFAILAEDWF